MTAYCLEWGQRRHAVSRIGDQFPTDLHYGQFNFNYRQTACISVNWLLPDMSLLGLAFFENIWDSKRKKNPCPDSGQKESKPQKKKKNEKSEKTLDHAKML